MCLVEDQLSDVDARGSEESDNLANERDLDHFYLQVMILVILIRVCEFSISTYG